MSNSIFDRLNTPAVGYTGQYVVSKTEEKSAAQIFRILALIMPSLCTICLLTLTSSSQF